MENIIKKLEEKEESNLEHQELIIAIKKIGLGGILNSIRSGIDKLDLTKLVANILRKTQLEERIIEFMGIPLHLYMVANILYFDNLNVNIVADLYSLYSKFIEEKILIYVEEKEGHLKEGIEKDRMVDRVREDTFRIHTELANQLFDEGIDTKLKKEDTELCAALGTVSIHGGKALFLHQTFAEFFKAESIRTKIEKKVFIEIISEEKYEVVRRFLSCALEMKGFENISEELFKDLDFVFEILKRIRNLCTYFNLFEMNSDLICSIKLVKQLLKQFKLSDDSELRNKFIKMLNKFINDKRDGAILISCCLNVEIIKYLINANLNYQSLLICGFVRFAENVEEVIDVLNEFISKESVSRSLFRRMWFKVFSSRRRENGANEEERVLNRILELLRTEDLNGNGLICFAIANQRAEIFAHLLEYLKNVLGKDQFFGEVIGSEEYKEQMKTSAIISHTNRICKLMKEIHLKFENEINILFDFYFKCNIILRAVGDVNDLSSCFENVINLFIEYFGITNLKEMLLNRNSYGEYLVHKIMKRSKNANLIKYLVLIKNVLGEEIKDFLKIKDEDLKNILHFTAQNRDEINFNFLNFYLSELEIKQLLFGRDHDGCTCLHFAAFYNLSQLPVFINYAIELLKSEKRVLEELLLVKDKDGETFIHFIAYTFYTSVEAIKQVFNNLRSKLSDDFFLKKLLRIRNKKRQTFLQIYKRNEKEELIECCKEILEKELFEELLRTEFDGGSECGSSVEFQ